jgi:thermitase
VRRRAFSLLSQLLLCSLFQSSICLAQDDYVSGEWIVRPDNYRAGWLSVFDALRGHFKFIRWVGTTRRYALIHVPGAYSPSKALGRTGQAQRNFRYHTLGGDPDFSKSWGLANTGQADNNGTVGIPGKDIHALDAWAFFQGSSQTIVAIIDGGISLGHDDLVPNLWVNTREKKNGVDDDANGFIDDINGWNFVDDDNDPNDEGGHGTFCAGLIGARADNEKGTRGVNARVSLMALKTMDKVGYGTTASAIAAIEYAVNNGATVINASWGGSKYDPALFDTVKWAGDHDVVFVAAAGNSRVDNDASVNRTYPASFRLPNVISVAAYDNRDELYNFSNYGKTTVDIGAPGVGIYSTDLTGYRWGEGTSFATPFVTGTVALLRGFDRTLTAADTRERILQTSDVISYYQKEKTVTAGRVNAYAALKNLRPPRPVAPTHWFASTETQATSHPYANNANQRMTITRSGATHIRVRFRKFDTESCCDRVTLRDASGKIVDSYGGTLGDFTSADAIGDTLYVDFVSDKVGTAYGFDIVGVETSFDHDLWWEREELLGRRGAWLGRPAPLRGAFLSPDRTQDLPELRGLFLQNVLPDLN